MPNSILLLLSSTWYKLSHLLQPKKNMFSHSSQKLYFFIKLF
jgi:hypothetical protein